MLPSKLMQKVVYFKLMKESIVSDETTTEILQQHSDSYCYENPLSFNIEPGEDILVIPEKNDNFWIRHGISNEIIFHRNRVMMTNKRPYYHCLWLKNIRPNIALHVAENTPLSSVMAQKEIIFKYCHISIVDLYKTLKYFYPDETKSGAAAGGAAAMINHDDATTDNSSANIAEKMGAEDQHLPPLSPPFHDDVSNEDEDPMEELKATIEMLYKAALLYYPHDEDENMEDKMSDDDDDDDDESRGDDKEKNPLNRHDMFAVINFTGDEDDINIDFDEFDKDDEGEEEKKEEEEDDDEEIKIVDERHINAIDYCKKKYIVVPKSEIAADKNVICIRRIKQDNW